MGASIQGTSSALSLFGVSKRFGATQALDEVDVTVPRGRVVALMGSNGAGKSTLAKIASGLVSPDRGRTVIAGQTLRAASPEAARRAGVVVVHQSTHELGVPGLSVAENLVLDQLCSGEVGALASPKRLLRRAQAIGESVALDIPLRQDFGLLGPAHRQLIAIARAVAKEAPVVIFDEPTASLSATEAERLFAVIDALKNRGVGVLYISHRLGDIRRVADEIVVLRNGRRVADQTKPFDFDSAIKAMIGRELETRERAGAAQAGETVLRMAGVRLTPGSKPFDLDIRAGEVLAVTGALGAGKSRLLGALFGLTRIAGGSFELDGAPWRPTHPAEAIQRGVFMAGEDRWRSSLLPATTPGGDIAGTVALPHRRSWFPLGVVGERHETNVADRLIRTLGVRCRGARDTLDLLSGGNQQKVVIGRWRAAPCRLLLLDEPFQGVDVGARRDIIEAIRTDRRQAATLIATNDVEEAVEVADVVAVMRDRSVVAVHDLRAGGVTSLLASIASIEAPDAAEEQRAQA
jgi:simple sugar transport system ATP-binding protein